MNLLGRGVRLSPVSTTNLRVFIVDSGARGHAIAWKVSHSPTVSDIIVSPGNAGYSHIAKVAPIPLDSSLELAKFAQKNKVDLTIVGPEAPLANGIVEEFTKRGLQIFGPSSKAAKIESSKWWAKQFMHRYNIPTPSAKLFIEPKKAVDYVQTLVSGSYVIKMSGLAAGKGVLIPESNSEAVNLIANKDSMFYPSEQSPILIEERIIGKEISVFTFVDGRVHSSIVAASDYKRVYEDDKGPNTGGVGSITPAHLWSTSLQQRIQKEIILPTINGLASEGIHYQGILYIGLLVRQNSIYVLEFNCRFGDPECQTILPLLENDIVEVCTAVAQSRLKNVSVKWRNSASVTIVLFSKGYPHAYTVGKVVTGLEEASKNGTLLFHAGTEFNSKGEVVTNSGRVLSVTCVAETLRQARSKAYNAANCIKFEGVSFRKDIAKEYLTTGDYTA